MMSLFTWCATCGRDWNPWPLTRSRSCTPPDWATCVRPEPPRRGPPTYIIEAGTVYYATKGDALRAIRLGREAGRPMKRKHGWAVGIARRALKGYPEDQR